jgi:hypothetical protein
LHEVRHGLHGCHDLRLPAGTAGRLHAVLERLHTERVDAACQLRGIVELSELTGGLRAPQGGAGRVLATIGAGRPDSGCPSIVVEARWLG